MSASPAVQPPPGNPRFPLVEGMRGIAILMVLVSHTLGATGATTHASWGWLGTYLYFGVILFFAISGFLLYRPYAVAHAGGRPAPQLRAYARRRLLRILPAYWVALTLLALWPGIDGPLSSKWWIYFGFMQVYSGATLAGGLSAAWSLCVEMTFYLLLPLLAALVHLLVGRLRPRPWWQAEAAVLALLFATAIATSALLDYHAVPFWVGNTLFATVDWFAGGMALAVLSVAAERTGRARQIATAVRTRSGLIWMLAGGTFLLAARVLDTRGDRHGRLGVVHPPLGTFIFNHLLLGITGLLMLMPAVMGASGAVRAVVAWRPLAYLGLLSYGIFLWHVPLTAWLATTGAYPNLHGGGLDLAVRGPSPSLTLTLAALAISAAAAAVSYHAVELPFLRLKEPRGRPTVAESAA
ncbi:MAG: acyltransferase [Solirubrobacteraceae bacterium]